MRSIISLAAAVLLALALPTQAKDDAPTARAKAFFAEGEKQYSLGRFEAALAAYQDAFLAKPLPGFLFNVAQCHRLLHQHMDAARSYRRFLELMPEAPNRAEVERLIASAEEALRATQNSTPPAGTTPPSAGAPAAGQPREAPQPPTTAEPTPAFKPTRAEISPTLEKPPTTASTPIFKKWWFWTALAGAAIAGTGAGIGIAYAVPNDAPATTGAMYVRF